MIDDSITELNKRLKKLRKEQASLQKKLKETEFDIGLIEDFIKLKKERKSVLHYVNGLYKKEIPLSFNKEMFNEKKVIYAINALTNGNVREISNFIHEIEGEILKLFIKWYSNV